MKFRKKNFDNIEEIEQDHSASWKIRDDLDITDYGSVFDQINKFLQFGSLEAVDYGEEDKELDLDEDTPLDMADDHIEREQIIKEYLNNKKSDDKKQSDKKENDDKKVELKDTVIDKSTEKADN